MKSTVSRKRNSPKTETSETDTTVLVNGVIQVFVRGKTPLIMNRMAEKAKRQLLLPSPKKNKAEKASNLKHDPMSEYRASVHQMRDVDAPTLLAMPSVAFKGALRNAAVDIPGAAKAEIGRLTYVRGEQIPIYGVPQMLMSVVRSSDIARTPDIRTRAIIPQWAAMLEIVYQKPLLTATGVANLFAAAGEIIGIGEFRPGKGAGNYGQFEVVEAKEIADIMETGGREAQELALQKPNFYDVDTEDLYLWYTQELERRGRTAVEA